MTRYDGLLSSPSIYASFRHERVFQAGGKTRTAATPQSARLDLVDHPVLPVRNNVFRAVPVAALKRSINKRTAVVVQVGEDAVFVREVAERCALRS